MHGSPTPEPADHRARLARLANQTCPDVDDVLLLIASEFVHVDRAAVARALDDLARPLFGLAELEPMAALHRLDVALAREARLVCAGGGVDCLLLDRVLAHRRGHPALVCAVYIEVARRAGLRLALFSTPKAWLVGAVRGDEAFVLEPGGGHSDLLEELEQPPPEARGSELGRGARDATAPEPRLRGHCSHELAWAVLVGLTRELRAAGRESDARRAVELRLLLPVAPDVLASLTHELDSFGG